jgi:4-hydroxybenzoate polyprenyltransferase
VFSTILIAAAGNIINDYFDVKADRINKPEKLIIGKYVKRRSAILAHWSLNFVAFAMAIYLSYIFQTFWYLFIHVLTINILWGYSSYFKRTIVVGNILIASLTGLVPLLVGIYYYLIIGQQQLATSFPIDWETNLSYAFWLIILLAVFAFVLNLAREIVKDMEDVKGDELIRAKTIPIVMGIKSAKAISAVLLLTVFIGIGAFVFIPTFVDSIAITPLVVCLLFVLIAFVLLLKGDKKSDYKRVNNSIKIAIVMGTLSPLLWNIIYIYG